MGEFKLFSYSDYALINNELVKNTKYSKRITSDNRKFEAQEFLDEVIRNSSKDDVYLFSYDSNKVDVIVVSIDFNPTCDIGIDIPVAGCRSDKESFEKRVRIKGYYAFIDFYISVKSVDSSDRIRISFDFNHPSIDEYRLYYKKDSNRNIIECADARVELKRYEFYKLTKNVFTFFANEMIAYSRIEFRAILLHFFDTNLSVMYSSLLESMSILTGKSVFDLDIEYKGMLSNFESIKKRIARVQLIARNHNEMSEKFSNHKLINARIELTTEDVVTHTYLWSEETVTRNYIEKLFSKRHSYCGINESEYFDKAVIFYDSYNRKILGLNYDSIQGILRDHCNSFVGMNAEKYNAINELFKVNSPNND